MVRKNKSTKTPSGKKIGRPKGTGKPHIYTEKHLNKLAKSLKDWVDASIQADGKQFLLRDWCFSSGFHYANFGRYIVKNKNFKEAYEWAKAWQEHQISKGALMNTLNSRFAQFFLGCNHNWRMKEKELDKERKALSALEQLNKKLNSIQDQIDAEQI